MFDGDEVYWLRQTFADVPSGDDWLTGDERATLRAFAFVKRRRDWRLGRWTAKRAVARAIGLADSRIEALAAIAVGTSPGGAPLCLVDGHAAPCAISISHSHGGGLCAVARRSAAVGCDLERVEPRTDQFAREWFTAAEREAIRLAARCDRDRIVTLLWSAKESALKALGAGLTVSTDALGVTVGPRVAPAAWAALSVAYTGSGGMHGWWCADSEDVMTIVTAPASGPPVTLST